MNTFLKFLIESVSLQYWYFECAWKNQIRIQESKIAGNFPKMCQKLFYLLPESVSGLVQRLTCFQDSDLVYNVCGSTSLVSIMWGRNKTNYLFYPCTGYIFISFFVIEN